ncbi:hypothetical protein GEMRC1_014073 [Eukaryota sp. GEM-RC1]
MTSSLTYSSFDVPLDTMTVCSGNLTFRNGSQYTGEILNGLPHGEGILTFISGTTVSGTFFNGQSTSETTITFPDKSVYTGDTLNSLPHDHGSYLGYSGSFHQGKRHGNGIYISDEVEHDGKWKFDSKDSHGTTQFRHSSSNVINLKGEYKNDLLEGSSEIEFQTGESCRCLFKGDFKRERNREVGLSSFIMGVNHGRVVVLEFLKMMFGLKVTFISLN